MNKSYQSFKDIHLPEDIVKTLAKYPATVEFIEIEDIDKLKMLTRIASKYDKLYDLVENIVVPKLNDNPRDVYKVADLDVARVPRRKVELMVKGLRRRLKIYNYKYDTNYIASTRTVGSVQSIYVYAKDWDV